MDLNQLNYFRVVAHEEHITRAAGQLNISQPALSRVISGLEEELGVSLFDRVGRNIRLNHCGQVLLKYTDQIFESIKNLHEEINDIKGGENGTITVGSSFPRRVKGSFSNVIGAFLLENPSISLQYYEMGPQELLQAVRTRQVDIIFTILDSEYSDLDSHCVLSEPIGVIMSPENYFAKKEHLSLRDLQNEVFLCNTPSTDLSFLTQLLCKRAGFVPRIQCAGEYTGYISNAVSKNLGVTLISERQAASPPPGTHPNNVFRPLEDPFCRREYSLAYLKGRYLPTAMCNFLEFVVKWYLNPAHGEL